MILLISGVPGTGKTFIGSHLAACHGFNHIDLESQDGHAFLCLLQQGRFDDFIVEVSKSGYMIVLTFGYPPEWLPVVEQLTQRGVKPIWLDAPILFCRKNWKPEVGQDPRTFTVQVTKIIDSNEQLNAFYTNKMICVCDRSAQNFLPVEELAQLILTSANV